MGLAMWCSSMCNKGCNKVPYRAPYRAIRGRDKVPYRAPYRAIRCPTRYLVAPPYRALRCAIRYLVALGTLHHLIAFHLILLCPLAPVAFFIRCCTHTPIFTHLLLSSQVTVVQWPCLDLVQAPEAPDVAGSKVGHVAPAAEAFTGVGEEWFLPGLPAVFEATGFGIEVTLPGQAATTKTHWCRSFRLKVRQGGVETVRAFTLPVVCSLWTSDEKTDFGVAVLCYVSYYEGGRKNQFKCLIPTEDSFRWVTHHALRKFALLGGMTCLHMLRIEDQTG